MHCDAQPPHAAWWTGLADMPAHDASALHALGLGFMAARTLHVALEFGLFTHLAGVARSLSQTAQVLGLAERATARLLHACVALGLVRLTDGAFSNTPIVEKYLVQGRPTYIGGYLQLFDTLAYRRWEQLGSALQQNAPVEAPAHPYRYLDDQEDEARTFLTAQHQGSTSLAQALARRIDFAPFHCLLDLGGGMGTYTIEILRRYRHLQAIVFDFPQVCRLAAAALQQAGLAPRTRTVGGDYEHDPLPHGPDVVLWSGNLHASSPQRCLQILQKLRALLPAHGMVAIHDYLLDDNGTGPLLPALLALHLTLVSRDGQVYRGAELHALLSQAGFAHVRVQSFLPGHSSLVLAQISAPPGEPARKTPEADNTNRPTVKEPTPPTHLQI